MAEGTATDSFVEAFNPTDPTHPSNIGPSHDEYYPTIAFNALLVVFTDPSLSDHHTAVVDAIMYIFRSLRLKVVTFLPQVRDSVRGQYRRLSDAVPFTGPARFLECHAHMPSRIAGILLPEPRSAHLDGQAARSEPFGTDHDYHS